MMSFAWWSNQHSTDEFMMSVARLVNDYEHVILGNAKTPVKGFIAPDA